jgi:superfamily II DNA or RNA helicase
MIDSRDALYNMETTVPELKVTEKSGVVELRAILAGEVSGEAKFTIEAQRAGKVARAKIAVGDVQIALSLESKYRPGTENLELHAPSARVIDGTLNLGESAEWKQHPLQNLVASGQRSKDVANSWKTYPVLQEELRDSCGNVVKKGLRLAQAGALHAIAAHWSVKTSHALVVLPTGTGKTEVMIAAALLASAVRTLVLVPSDALRTQISTKLLSLGMLEEVGAISKDCLRPVVGSLTRSPRSRDDFEALLKANVVVTTTQMLLKTEVALLSELLGIFDFVAFDEAHHLPAPSWVRIREAIAESTKILSLTATPYRNDGKRLSGELIYQFPLRIAQKHGYFTNINVTRIDQSRPELADLDIANAAVCALRRDESAGFQHVILARSKSKEHANGLLELYQDVAPDLSPVLLHSDMSEKKKNDAISRIKSLQSRIVICVDMLGEGFDFSALKIAAMHELHKSLPVTLQFIGRFTRASKGVGSATVVINMSEPMANTAVSELFAEDADWNDLVPQLSAGAIDAGIEIQVLSDKLKKLVTPDDKVFDISLLSPGLSVLLYRVEKFEPGSFGKGVGKGSILHQSWADEGRELLVAITRDFSSPDWSQTKEAVGFEWNLFVAAYDSSRNLLMVNSSLGQSKTLRLVHAVSGKGATQVVGEEMFRVFDGLKRAILHNVGLYKRGQVRFQMLVGMDVGAHVSHAVQAGSSKSNLFAAGYEDGAKENIGASFKGRVWSMSSASIPSWISWAKKISKKVLDSTIATNSFLSFTLIPTEINSPPQTRIFSCIPPDELLPGSYHGEKHLRYAGAVATITQSHLDFNFKSVNGNSIEFAVSADGYADAMFRMTWSGGFSVSRVSGPHVFVLDKGSETSLHEYLCINPPALILVDGSELIGKYHFKYLSSPVYTYSSASIHTPIWGSTSLSVESKWKAGVRRPNSIQDFIISMLAAGSSSYIFDDDDSGEVADVIAIEDDQVSRELKVSLYHCKYAHGSAPSARVADLYEVCGQAIKSCRIINRAEDLVGHIVRREGKLGGRPTRFEKGTILEIKSLQKRVSTYRMRLEIFVVQPGLSAGALTPEMSSILGAADNFVLEFTGHRLSVFGSP